MKAHQTPVGTERRAFSQVEFFAWLDEDSTRVLISEAHDHYYAYCVEFGIAAAGRTEEEAVASAVEMMMKYLVLSFSEGRTYRDARKAPPFRIRLRLLRKRLLRVVKPRLSQLGGLISVPTHNGDVQHLAH